MSALRRVEIGDSRWSDFAASRPEASLFHNPAWAQLLAECYGFDPFALVLEEEGEIRAGLPMLEIRGHLGGRRWVSLPFTDNCPPLASDPGVLPRLPRALDEARAAAGAEDVVIHAELRGPGAGTWVSAVTHSLDLQPDSDAVFATFHRSQVQRSVRKAEREGVELRRAEHESELTEDFYRLHLETRRRQGTPIQPYRFFGLLWKRVLEPGLGFLTLARVGDVPVAGAVFLVWNETVIYKYGASDPRYLGVRPNHLLFWDAIRWSCEQGYKRFDFGRSDVGHSSLRDFKSRWGTEERPLRYTSLSGGARDLTEGLAARALGEVIRRSPPWVCERLGAALYRYVA